MSADDKCTIVDNARDLEKVLKDKDKVIALVYASWCPFCAKFLPIFMKYAQDDQRQFLRIQDDRESIADSYSIEVFPTVLFLEKGAVTKRLDGARGAGLNEKQLANFIASCPAP
jgi:thiol-disulfide isomerase/thioredoxin